MLYSTAETISDRLFIAAWILNLTFVLFATLWWLTYRNNRELLVAGIFTFVIFAASLSAAYGLNQTDDNWRNSTTEVVSDNLYVVAWVLSNIFVLLATLWWVKYRKAKKLLATCVVIFLVFVASLSVAFAIDHADQPKQSSVSAAMPSVVINYELI